VVPGSRARLVDGFDPPYICSDQRRDAVTEPEPKPPMRRAVTVRLDDDPLGYDVSDIEDAVRRMIEDALSGRVQDAVEAELVRVRGRFGQGCCRKDVPDAG
jgi:hypothetical protein